MDAYRGSKVFDIDGKKCKCMIYYDDKADLWIGECSLAGDIPLEPPASSHSEDKELMLMFLKEDIGMKITEHMEKGITRFEKCPYCGSDDVTNNGTAHAVGKQPLKYLYQCKNSNCLQTFYVLKKD